MTLLPEFAGATGVGASVMVVAVVARYLTRVMRDLIAARRARQTHDRDVELVKFVAAVPWPVSTYINRTDDGLELWVGHENDLPSPSTAARSPYAPPNPRVITSGVVNRRSAGGPDEGT